MGKAVSYERIAAGQPAHDEPSPERTPHVLLTLQQTLGNQAVTRLVGGGQLLDKSLRAAMEDRFGYDFSGVRVHTDPLAQQSARNLHAKAYTVQEDIVFGPDRYAPQTSEGRTLIAHELAHVIQQSRGGPSPALDPTAAHEQDADAAAQAAVSGEGPVTVQGATGPGIARAVDDWLIGSPNIQDEGQWPDSALQDEIDDIEVYLADRIESTPETARLEEALDLLQTELRRRHKRMQPQQPRRRRKSRRGTRDAGSQPDDLEKPRILREQTSVQYTDPAEMRQESDRIAAWLRHGNPSADEREILQMEYQNLAGLLEQDRQERATQQRLDKVQQALTPKTKADPQLTDAQNAKAQLMEAVRLIDSIKPLPGREMEFSYIMSGDEMIVIPAELEVHIREGVMQKFDDAIKKIERKNKDTQSSYEIFKDIQSEHPVTSRVVAGVGWVFGQETLDPGGTKTVHISLSKQYLTLYEDARRNGRLIGMASAMVDAEKHAAIAEKAVHDWRNDTISTGEGVVLGLQITRDLSFTIVSSYLGGGALAGARAAGLLKTGAQILAIGGGTALAQGGGNLAGQALAGGETDWGEVGTESLKGLGTGTAGAVTPFAARGIKTAVEAGKALPVLSNAAVRSTVTAGATNVAGGALFNLGQGNLPTLQNAGVDLVTGVAGHGLNTGLGRFVKTPALRTGLGLAGESALGGVGAELTGGEWYQGAASSLAVGSATRFGQTLPTSRRSLTTPTRGELPPASTAEAGSGLELDTSGTWPGKGQIPSFNEIDLGPVPKTSGLELDTSGTWRGKGETSRFNEIDLGLTPDTSGLKLYRGKKPVGEIPGVRKTPNLTFGEPSGELSGTFRRTGMHFNELNAAEMSPAQLRTEYDVTAGRPSKISYEVYQAVRAEGGQVTDRTFTRDVSTEGAQSSNKAYTNSGYDRGHLAQREAFKGYGDAEIAVDHWTNVVPMTPDLNRGAGSPWAAAERRTVDYVKPVSEGGQGYQSVKVVVEPVYDANPPRLSDGTPIPKAIRRTVIAPDGTVLEDASYLNR